MIHSLSFMVYKVLYDGLAATIPMGILAIRLKFQLLTRYTIGNGNARINPSARRQPGRK